MRKKARPEKEKTPSPAASQKNNFQKSETALREEAILQYWRERGIFEKTLAKSSPKGEFVFYDGPPFATGLPHYGSLLSSVIKDVIPRYKTMQGYHVRRRWGWDCHGLPIENLVEKKLGLKNKKEIYDIGIAAFNEACRAEVLRYADEWEKYVDRIGRWVNFRGAYKTMDNSYIESVWWGLSEMYKKGLLYEGRKVLLYCPRCETPIAKAEVAQDNSYKDVTEESVYVKFKVRENAQSKKLNLPENTYLLAWTTTPWTLPGNVALAVGEEIEYVLVEKDDAHLVLARGLLDKVLPEVSSTQAIKGKDLVGLSYEPLFDVPKVTNAQKKNTHTVLPAEFVTTDEGTGIVHTAVIYGEDDYELGLKFDLPMVPLLNASGHFNEDAPEVVRVQYFKKASKTVADNLDVRGLLFQRERYTHSYPHCHRCDTPLIYNALTSWFINIQKVKKELLKTNEDINWVPAHLKHGRYKNILEGAPDWTISRNRFWASPLPIWKHPETDEVTLIGSLEELKRRTKKSGNRYFVMRHGEGDHNLSGLLSSEVGNPHHLTEKGKTQVREAAHQLKTEHIDLVVHSPLVRTRETAELLADELGLSRAQILVEERFTESRGGVLEGRPVSEWYHRRAEMKDPLRDRIEGGESFLELRQRMLAGLFDLERTHRDKNIVIVGHGLPLCLLKWSFELSRMDALEELVARWNTEGDIKTGSVHPVDVWPFPHNASFELDLHRPYIDEVTLLADDGAELSRIPEVIDCWVESGSMPFAEHHYPYARKEDFTDAFPADFIAEYIAQTRTWFYYMHAVSVALFGKPSFKNVVSTGTILAEDGSKMSKSKGNYTDPFENFDAYGADALRYYLMSSPVMSAEDLRFSDTELREAHNRVIGLLWNTYSFYALYKHQWHEGVLPEESPHVLDRWLLSRLSECITEVTAGYETYDVPTAVRPLRAFIEDLSTWYLRRSRERIKGDDEQDRRYALATLRYVLGDVAKIIAPVMPFIAESIYQGVGGDEESVHMETWPSPKTVDRRVLTTMRETRDVVSQALKARADAGVKVRQPLASITVAPNRDIFEDLVCDEVNVKKIVRGEVANGTLILDTALSRELVEEGVLRDIIRTIQQMRKDAGLTPRETVALAVHTDEAGRAFLSREEHMRELMRAAGVAQVVFAHHAEGELLQTTLASFVFRIPAHE